MHITSLQKPENCIVACFLHFHRSTVRLHLPLVHQHFYMEILYLKYIRLLHKIWFHSMDICSFYYSAALYRNSTYWFVCLFHRIWFDSMDVCLFCYSAALYSLVKSCLVDSSVSSASYLLGTLLLVDSSTSSVSAALYLLGTFLLVDSSTSSVSAATCTSYNIFLLGSNAASVSAMFTSYNIFLVDSSANSA